MGKDAFTNQSSGPLPGGRRLATMTWWALFAVIVTGFFCAPILAAGRYEDGDWLGYTSTRFITSVAIGPEFVYFGTPGGILRFDRFSNRWSSSWTVIDGLPTNRVQSIAYDPELQTLHARTIDGDVVYNPASREFEFTGDFPESLVTYWRNIELLNYNLPTDFSALEENFLTDGHLRDFLIQGAVTDDWGNLWVGTWGLGVWRGSEYSNDLEPLPYGLAQSNVRAIERLGPAWWFAGPQFEGEPPGVTVYDTLQESWKYHEARFTNGFASDQVLQLARTGDTIWLATNAGLTRYCAAEAETFRTYNEFDGLFSNLVTAIEPDGDLIWVGTDLGVNALLIPQDSLVRATNPLTNGVYVYDLKVIDDFVWMGTDRGLFRLFKENGAWRRFSAAESILNGHVRAIADDDTAFYFGTDQGLAMVFRDGSGVREFISEDVVPGGEIYALAVTERIVWVSTPFGLVRFDPRTEKHRLFDRADGLFDDFVQVIYRDGDYLWLGTQEGVQRFFWKNPYRID